MLLNAWYAFRTSVCGKPYLPKITISNAAAMKSSVPA